MPGSRDDGQFASTGGAVDRVRLRSGERVSIRPLRHADGPGLVAMVDHLSAKSRYRRFHSAMPHLTPRMTEYLTAIDHRNHEALIALAPDGREIIAVARFIRDPQHVDTAELAIVVADAWQRRGLATALLTQLAQRAAELGISEFTADVQASNRPTIELINDLEEDADISRDGAVSNVRMHNLAWRPQDDPTGRSALRAAFATATDPSRPTGSGDSGGSAGRRSSASGRRSAGRCAGHDRGPAGPS